MQQRRRVSAEVACWRVGGGDVRLDERGLCGKR